MKRPILALVLIVLVCGSVDPRMKLSKASEPHPT
jgi:hypothetical protein